jgi:hypothetical protein
MSIVLLGSTSGSITFQEPAVAGSTTINLPATSGTAVVGSSAVSAAGQIPFSTDGSTYTPTAKIVSGTTQASTSGTSIDFTGIPSWVKRITVMFNAVSASGTSILQIQLGSGSVQTTGYVAAAANDVTGTTLTSGFPINDVSSAAAETRYGTGTFSLVGSNIWVGNGTIHTPSGNSAIINFAGGVTLSGALDRVRITTVNGTDTFDAGSINILYE